MRRTFTTKARSCQADQELQDMDLLPQQEQQVMAHLPLLPVVLPVLYLALPLLSVSAPAQTHRAHSLATAQALNLDTEAELA